jgi:hypothetical protein
MKPKVIGYKQVGFEGNRGEFSLLITKERMLRIARSDYAITGKKSIFRPVYG